MNTRHDNTTNGNSPLARTSKKNRKGQQRFFSPLRMNPQLALPENQQPRERKATLALLIQDASCTVVLQWEIYHLHPSAHAPMCKIIVHRHNRAGPGQHEETATRGSEHHTKNHQLVHLLTNTRQESHGNKSLPHPNGAVLSLSLTPCNTPHVQGSAPFRPRHQIGGDIHVRWRRRDTCNKTNSHWLVRFPITISGRNGRTASQAH